MNTVININKEKVPLILFTGGMDSTLMLQQSLKRGSCDVLYIFHGQSVEVMIKEKAALNAIIAVATKDSEHSVEDVHYTTIPEMVNDDHDTDTSKIARLLTAAVSQIDPHLHTTLMVGGVKGDPFFADRDKLGRLWTLLTSMTKFRSLPLDFPLASYSKHEVIANLNPELAQLTVYCEAPTDEPCRVCTSCKALGAAMSEYRRIQTAVSA
jgi:7-cyano-7-deazaguanine synthase in queuosine biosynthesis